MSPGWRWHSERWHWRRGVPGLGHSASTSRARSVGLGLLERADCPRPPCYHVVHKAFVDRNKECLVGELVVQEIHEVKASLGGVTVGQEHLGMREEMGLWVCSLSLEIPAARIPTSEASPPAPPQHTHPVEGGEVSGGSQDIKQFPVARADPVTHEANSTLASHVCRKGGSVAHRGLLRSSGGERG